MYSLPSFSSISLASRLMRRASGSAAASRVIAVVKADAYGLGIDRVLPVLADVASGFCVFSLAEAVSAKIRQRTAKPILALSPSAAMT